MAYFFCLLSADCRQSVEPLRRGKGGKGKTAKGRREEQAVREHVSLHPSA